MASDSRKHKRKESIDEMIKRQKERLDRIEKRIDDLLARKLA